MKSLTLLHDIFIGVPVLGSFTKRAIVAIISSTKFILENKSRLRIDINYEWRYASLNKDNLIDSINLIKELTNLEIFHYSEAIYAISNMKDVDFDKVINIINEVVDSNNVISYCNKLRGTAKVEGKIHDTNTQYRILEIPIKIINPSVEDSVVDYFNGESGTEIVLKQHLKLDDGEGNKLNYYGQEINNEAFAIGQLINFLITGGKDRIVKGDSLTKPILVENKLKKFDVSISNPPFMMKVDKDVIKNDKFNRFKYGVSQNISINSDWIIVNHVLSVLKENGKGAVLLPIGALFRGGAEERIRKEIISEDLIEVVVRIPSNVLSYTNIMTCWIILNKNKKANRKDKIQFVDLTEFVESIDRRNYTISENGINLAVDAYKKFEENEISFILDKEKLQEKQYDLNAFEYIKSEKIIKSINHIDMVEFSSIAQIRRGVQVNKGKLDALNTGSRRTHYLISIGNIIDDKIVVNESDKIQIESKWEGVYEVKKGDVLITSKGTQFKVAIVEDDIKAIVSANLFIVRTYDDIYLPEILKYYLESELGQSLIQGIIKGTAIKSIAYKDIQKFLVPNIDMKTQRNVVIKIKQSQNDYNDRICEAKKIYNEEQKEIKNILNLTMKNS